MPPIEVDLGDQVRYIRRRWCTCAGAELAREEERQAARERQGSELLTRAGLQSGKRARMTFAAWDSERNPPWARRALARVQAYVAEVTAEGQNWLYLHGPYGVGKTHLAVAALRRIAYERLWRPQIAVWPAHCAAVQQSWTATQGAAPSERQLWGALLGADILLLDDIDKRRPTPWAMEQLYQVVDHRQNREKPTLITANHNLAELAALWTRSEQPEEVRDTGAAILSRIAGQLWGTVELGGMDQRWR